MDRKKTEVWRGYCRGKGLGSYIGHWALSKDINWSEDKEVNDERPPGPNFVRRKQMSGRPRSTYSSDLMSIVQNI